MNLLTILSFFLCNKDKPFDLRGNVTFSASYGDYWVKNKAGDVGYIDGQVKIIESKPKDVFVMLSTEFGKGFYEQNVWSNPGSTVELDTVLDDEGS
ncbi:hypothetical protein F2Q70_00010769 [Brassica cretica]|uniref:Uncharacterized protein n=1 Tax=Brassica cretica TaxID=69181 RepID=A0A8S9MFY4_BRACR|nr:hypothetical protein F2Q70_00010769 [Brassica cretica]